MDLISQVCVSVALNTFVRVCDSVYTRPFMSVCLWGLEAVLGFLCLRFPLSEDPSHVSAPFSLSFIPGPHPPHIFLFFLSTPPHQVDPGPREGRPPGLVVLSRAPQPPPPAPRHEPPLPKNQAGVAAAQGRGGQEEVRLQSLIAPLPVSPLNPPGWATSLCPSWVQQPGHQSDLSLCSVQNCWNCTRSVPALLLAPDSSPCPGLLGGFQLRGTLLALSHHQRPKSLLTDSPLACELLLSVSVGLTPGSPVT